MLEGTGCGKQCGAVPGAILATETNTENRVSAGSADSRLTEPDCWRLLAVYLRARDTLSSDKRQSCPLSACFASCCLTAVAAAGGAGQARVHGQRAAPMAAVLVRLGAGCGLRAAALPTPGVVYKGLDAVKQEGPCCRRALSLSSSGSPCRRRHRFPFAAARPHQLLQQQIPGFGSILREGTPDLHFHSCTTQIKNKHGNRGRNELFGKPLGSTNAVRL